MDFKTFAQTKGFNLDKGFKQVGFALDALSANQISYCCIENTNRWLAKNYGTNFSIFYQENSLPCKAPQFARFHIKDSIAFSGHIIATSFNTLTSIKEATRSRRYYYINDLEWERPWFRFHPEQVNNLLHNDSIVKFTRSLDHYNKLKAEGIKLFPLVVDNFNIDQILEITNNAG